MPVMGREAIHWLRLLRVPSNLLMGASRDGVTLPGILDVIRGSGPHIFVYGGSLQKLNSWSGWGRKGGGQF